MPIIEKVGNENIRGFSSASRCKHRYSEIMAEISSERKSPKIPTCGEKQWRLAQLGENVLKATK